MGVALPALSDFDDWVIADYLADYYSRVECDERHTLRFLVDAFKHIRPGATALAFGVGPTVHHLLALSRHVRQIHAADYLPANLDEIRRWRQRDDGAHDWRPFTKHILDCEGVPDAGDSEVQRREDLTRQRITKLVACDAGQNAPVPTHPGEAYDVVVSCYCAESATADKATWMRYMRNILRVLRPGGLFVMAALRRCRGYKVGSRVFPCADIDEGDVAQLLDRCGFDLNDTQLQVASVPGQRELGYEGIVLAAGTSAMSRRDGAPTRHSSRSASRTTASNFQAR